jgi:hypothetical protein
VRDPQEIAAEAVALLRALERGEVVPSSVFDPNAWGAYWAASTLWQGDFELSQQDLYWVYDPVKGYFTPVVSGLVAVRAGDRDVPLPPAFTADHLIQSAYVRHLVHLRDSEMGNESGDGYPEAIYLALVGYLDDATWPANVLEGRRSRIAELISPDLPVFVESSEGDGSLLLRVENVSLFPVELVGIECEEHAAVPVDAAWLVRDHAGNALILDRSVLLRSRGPSEPVVIVLTVPWQISPLTACDSSADLRIVVRILGTDDQMAVPVEPGSIDAWGLDSG